MAEELERYVDLQKIGEGGFATVYRAQDVVLDRPVALKELNPHLLSNSEWVQRFTSEARTIARLDHPRIVTIFDVVEVDGRLFIVMRLVDGPSLDVHLANEGALSWHETLEMIESISEGLDYAHSQGILHRDLKPGNILLDTHRGPLLSDFGLAKLVGEAGSSFTAAGGIVGTPNYIAPEVWEGQGASCQSDIYALGCILYEMLVGEKLFAGQTPPAIMMAHFQSLNLPQIWPEDVPPAVADVLTTALAKQPNDRYATIGEMTAELTRIVETEPERGIEPIQVVEMSEAARQLESDNQQLIDKNVVVKEKLQLTGEGEIRVVTVLSVRLSEVDHTAEVQHPEATLELVNRLLGMVEGILNRYEVQIERFLGEQVLVVFGTPQAREDDPERALRAALDIQTEAKRQGFLVGVGINTGDVYFGRAGVERHQDVTVMGPVVNLASRLAGMSAPGDILVGAGTYRLSAAWFNFEVLAPIQAGATASTSVYRLIGEKPIRTRFEAAIEGGLTPYVGRDQELGMLTGIFERLKIQRGQAVFISGEAGIGKSRLLAEFRQALRTENFTWLEGQCISFQTHTPYLPLIDLLKHAFGLKVGDSEAHIIQQVEEHIATWEEGPRGTGPYLRFLLSVDPGDPELTTMDPRLRRAGILDGLRALLLQESKTQPLVVVIEDLHWIDEQSEAALAALVDIVAVAPILLVFTYRLDYSHMFGERNYFNYLVLDDLQPAESKILAQNVLETTELPPELGQLIANKGEGNPLYIEEVVKSLLELGILRQHNDSYELTKPIEKVWIPDTLQKIILSRIDGLAQRTRATLQLASVIGREFPMQLLEHISDLETELDEVLEELKLRELIYQCAYFPEQAYMFKHALTQGVAYSTLLRERRKSLHQLIGGAIEELYSDRLVEQYEALAYHYFEGEAWEQALDYLTKAAEKAVATYANRDALDFYTRALEICDKLGDPMLNRTVELLRRRGCINWAIAEEPQLPIADFTRMLEIARKLKDRRLEAMALALRGDIEFSWLHDLKAAEETFKTALQVAGDEYEDVRLLACVRLANLFLVYNRHTEAKSLLQVAEELAPGVGEPLILGWWSYVGTALPNWEGRFQDAVQHATRWRDIPLKESEPVSYLIAHNKQWFEAIARGGKGEYEQALAILEDQLETSERYFERKSPQQLNTMGWLYGELQDPYQAMNWNKEAIDVAQELGFADDETDCNARLNLADNLLALGRHDEAEEHLRYVEQIVRQPRTEPLWMLWRYAQHLFHSFGDLWLMRGDYEKALSYADECLELAEGSNSRKNIVKGRRLRGQALLAQGNLVGAEQELTAALKIAQSVRNPPQLWKTHAALGDLRQAQGNLDAARQSYGHALTVIEKVATSLKNETLRDTFLNSDHIQEIRGKAPG